MPREMSPEERDAFLADVHVGIITIARDRKGPLTIPMWYDYQPGGDVWFTTSGTSFKANLLAKTDRMSLCVQSENNPYAYVSVEGPFVVSPRTDEQMLHMATRYLGERGGPRYVAASNSEDPIVVSITPETWYTADYAPQ